MPPFFFGDLPGDLVLVHGREDIAVPFTESVALARRRPQRTCARDLLALWSVVYGLVSRA